GSLKARRVRLRPKDAMIEPIMPRSGCATSHPAMFEFDGGQGRLRPVMSPHGRRRLAECSLTRVTALSHNCSLKRPERKELRSEGYKREPANGIFRRALHPCFLCGVEAPEAAQDSPGSDQNGRPCTWHLASLEQYIQCLLQRLESSIHISEYRCCDCKKPF